MNTKKISDKNPPGGTKDALQFGQEVNLQLSHIARYGTSVVHFSQTDHWCWYKNYLMGLAKHNHNGRSIEPAECDLVWIISPLPASKGQHHPIVVDPTGFHKGFYDFIVKKMKKVSPLNVYRRASKLFLSHYFQFAHDSHAKWAKWFHLHFTTCAEVQPTEQFWLDLVIAQHDSDISFIREANFHLWMVDANPENRSQPFVPVDLQRFYDHCRELIAGPEEAVAASA